MNNLKYSTIIRSLTKEDGGGYLIEIPELPGCIADTELWIQAAKEFGDAIPDAN